MKKIFEAFSSCFLILSCRATPPLALHQLVEVETGGEVVISLYGHDIDGDETIATITTLPKSGTLYQLSHIFNTHGHDPKFGTPITNVPVEVYGKRSSVVYKRPEYDREDIEEWGRFQYTVADKKEQSSNGTVVLVSVSKVVVASDFRFSEDKWTTIGNNPNGVNYERTSRGKMSNYIYAADNSLNIDADGNDSDLWYFKFPDKFYGWHGIVYGGRMEFDLSSFGGDFSPERQNQSGNLNLVQIYCSKCRLNQGIRIGFPLHATDGFDGTTSSFSLRLTETSGWLKDSQSTLLDWTVPTKCDMIEVLSGISSIQLLGDFTKWYESVSLDNVKFVVEEIKGRNQLPKCAQGSPDARKCSCR